MKKKILILGTIFSILVMSLGIIFLYAHKKQIAQKEKQEKIILATKKKYNFFMENTLSKNKNNDDTIAIFNNIITESNKNSSIDFDNFATTNLNVPLINNNIDIILQTIESETEKYQINLLDFSKKDIKSSIKTNDDEATILSLYDQNNFIKNLDEEKTKRNTYLESLNALKEDLTFLRNNKDYTVKDDVYICKNDEIVTKLQEFSEKYHISLNVQKQVETKNDKAVIVDNGVPILCYHGILDVPWGQANLFVKTNDFEEQMKYLNESGYTPIFASEIANAKQYKKPIIITFDDGYKDVYTNAFPILKKYNIKANIYIISGWINGDVYMSTADLKEMASSPLIEVGSHTVSHKALATLGESQIEEEVKNSQENLQEVTGQKVDVIAYPTGSFDDRVINITKKYYKYGLSTIKGKENPEKLNTYSLRRIYVYRNLPLTSFKNLF